MTVYFYHTQDIQYILKRMEEGAFPSHFLYGATHLKDHGIDVVWHPSDISLSGWRRMVRTTWKVLTCQQHFDALYATHYTGIEPLIFLRALHLFRKPIVIWHHQPIITPKQRWREWLGRLFYRGIDEMFFFSEKLIQDSMKSTKARTERMHLAHWGADLELYASLGIRNITSYGAWIDDYYVKTYGDISFVKYYGESLRDYRPKK